MKVEAIRQQAVDFLGFEGQVMYDEATGELVIKPAKYKLFEHLIDLPEERFVPEVGDRLYITDRGLVLVRDDAEIDLNCTARIAKWKKALYTNCKCASLIHLT